MNARTRICTLLAAAGACAGLTSLANAQGTLINISGATLLENYVRSTASTNDYIDVDGDGIAGIFNSGLPDQLAVGSGTGPFSPDQKWIVQYRVVGSVNGFIELTRFGTDFVTTNDTDVNGILGNRISAGIAGGASAAYNNRTLYITLGDATGAYNQGNPGGAVNRADLTTLQGTYSPNPTPAAGGIRIDIAPLDVSTVWAVKQAGTSGIFKKPAQAGYGSNARLSVNRDGGTTGFAGLPATLADLNGRNLFNEANPSAADANTIFDSELAFATIAPVVSLGTGISQITITELQHLFVTGRGSNGENLVVATRDVGSGTRNAFMNCIGVDPSYGVGDSIGGLSTAGANNNLGPSFTPTNKGSNGGMEATIRNHRLAIGYVGTERGVTGSGSGSWLTTNALEIAAVQNDIYGGTAFVRPTTFNIVNNNANGWVIGGQAVLSTIGDPKAEPVSAGGENNGRPAMRNAQAAAYMNNIRKSIAAFVAVPNAPENTFMPGEFAATQFILLAALDNLHPVSDPAALVPNPAFNLNLQNYTLSNNVHNNAAFNAFNTSSTGRVPTRVTGTYSDGIVGGASFQLQSGGTVASGAVIPLRSKIAGDFSGNGLRNVGDAGEMLKAWRQRNGGPVWVAPAGTGAIAGAASGDASIELLGDFNGDGSFTSADVRYFADGLAIATSGPNAGKLDRKAGFIAVDNASVAAGAAANFFGTTLATGKPYAAGDARGDVIGASGNVARGWAPVGADGVVNAADINYVYAQFKTNSRITDGAANWADLNEAAYFDLSADMNGDLVVDQADIVELVTVILGTGLGDVNLDGVCDAADLAIAQANLAVSGGWAQGDVDGDGIVTSADIAIIQGCIGPVCGTADFDGDGDSGTDADIEAFFACLAGTCCDTCFSADFDGDGDTGTDADIEAFFRVLAGQPC